MALTCVAIEYILRERLKNSQVVPLLSANNIRLLIAREIRTRETYHCDNQRIEQLKNDIVNDKKILTVIIMNSIYQSRFKKCRKSVLVC